MLIAISAAATRHCLRNEDNKEDCTDPLVMEHALVHTHEHTHTHTCTHTHLCLAEMSVELQSGFYC